MNIYNFVTKEIFEHHICIECFEYYSNNIEYTFCLINDNESTEYFFNECEELLYKCKQKFKAKLIKFYPDDEFNYAEAKLIVSI